MYVVDKCNLQFNPIPLACPLRKKTKTKKAQNMQANKNPQNPKPTTFPETYRINQDASQMLILF